MNRKNVLAVPRKAIAVPKPRDGCDGGATASFKVYVVLTTENEAGSNAEWVTRTPHQNRPDIGRAEAAGNPTARRPATAVRRGRGP